MRSILVGENPTDDVQRFALATLLGDAQCAAYVQLARQSVDDIIACYQPGQLKRNVTALINRLESRHRLLNCSSLTLRACDSAGPCSCHVEIANATHIVGAPSIPGPIVINLGDYIGSEISLLLRNSDVSIDTIESKAAWENSILIPLFRLSRKVTFIDRLLGDKWSESTSFRASFSWLLDVLQRNSPFLESVTLFTTVRSRSTFDQLKIFCKQRFVTLENRVYVSGEPDSLPHARFILTESLGLRVDQGLDLLVGENVSPSKIAIQDDPGSEVNRCRRAQRVTPR